MLGNQKNYRDSFYNLIGRIENKRIYPYLYIGLALIFFLIYVLYPIIFSFIISSTNWDGLRPLAEAEYIFFGNYIKLFSDEIFWLSLKNTVFFILGVLIFQNLFGVTLALTLFYAKIKGSRIYRSIIFFPAILSPVIVALIWRLILAKDGLFNEVLAAIGLGFLKENWLANMVTPIFCIVGVNVWQWSGYNMVIYYAGLQSIPEELIEAAKIDGANWRQTIFKIIFPNLSSAITIAMAINIIGGFKVFDLVYALTRGGPAHYSEVLATYMFFHSFGISGSNLMGYASSIAIMMTVIVFVLAVIRVRMARAIEY